MRVLDRLGTVWSVLGASGTFWERLRALGDALAFGSVWESSGSVWEVGAFWERPGSVWEGLRRVGNVLGAFGSVWERFGEHLEASGNVCIWMRFEHLAS